ncbi:swr complex subunit [Mortierella sp. GBA43]|nr:swr complex subunit [Mortierella sp. GBA43]
MATGNDVRDIFQLKPAEPVKRVHRPEKKPGNRELYGLIGNNVTTVAFNNPTYKPKLNVSKKAVNWTWRPFVNPSRDDDLVLHHWEKSRTDPNEEYRFYKFNKAINLNEFTAEEYVSYNLQDSDWSLEETNYLWDLCRRFDLRWVVIQDRYEWPPQEVDRLALSYYNGNNTAGVPPSNTTNTADATEEVPIKIREPSPLPLLTSTDTPVAASTTDTGMTETDPTTSAAASTSIQDSPVDTNQGTTLSSAAQSTSPSTSLSTPSTGTTTTTAAITADNATTTAATTTATTTTTTTAAATATAAATTTTTPAPTPMELVTYTPPKTRSMEELKNRYYTINRILTKARMNDPSQAVEKAQLLSSLSYDMDREVERKRNLEILNNRTPEQIEEEEALYLEARRIDQNEKKIAREREHLLRLLSTRDMYGGGPASAGLAGQVVGAGGSGTGIIIPSNSITIPSSSPSNNTSSNNGPLSPVVKSPHSASVPGMGGSQNIPTKKRKKAPKGSNQAEDSTAPPGGSSSSHTKLSSSNRRPSNASSVNDVTLPQGVQVKKEKLTPGAYLRSQKMTPIVSTKQQRLQTTLTQLGLPLRPSMPTAAVMGKWDQLTNNIVALLDLKKQVDKLEADLKVVKMRRGSASGVGLFPSGSSGSASGAGGSSSGAGGSATVGSDGNFGVKREGAVDESGTSGQKKKKRKE